MDWLLQYWYFHIPNYLIAALIYTLLGRFVLGIFVPDNWDNFIWKFFKRFTDPALRVTAWITPSFMVPALMPLVAVFWLFVLRLAYYIILYQFGLAPSLEVEPSA